MMPEMGLIMAYIHRNTLISTPNASALCSSTMSMPMALCMVDSIWRSI